MQIIPVIDLKDGLVVHAVRGNRAHYPPIHLNSELTSSSQIDAVLAAFLNLYAFKQFYIADLNAITGSGDHTQQIYAVVQAYPEIEFWIDNGCQLSTITPTQSNKKWVIGTESQALAPKQSSCDFILSLDYKHQQEQGNMEWFQQSQFWPETIIAMTLNRVGSNSGPDFAKLKQLQQSHPDKCWVAAGGIRHFNDLLALKQVGIQTALVATALHNGAINQDNIQNC